ncbi:helix-turn-helix transcriptional regulator [Nakamurella sp. A5-74]|uniref:Helix-turn-helix transcriptional regulator n=1 Tax=Nakamurella sp. A5-74 TaxID=3158264 RepID=A0AAU8DQK9_9ACTN
MNDNPSDIERDTAASSRGSCARVRVGSEEGAIDEAEHSHLRDGFGRMLRETRTAVDLSVAQVAKLSGLAERSIRHLEAGTRRPGMDTVLLLGLVLQRPEPLVRLSGAGGEGKAPQVSTLAADKLAQRLRELAGDSLRQGHARRSSARAVAHWRRFGMSEDERSEQMRARVVARAMSTLSVAAGSVRAHVDLAGRERPGDLCDCCDSDSPGGDLGCESHSP